mgnify:CR=1 FL=1
MSYIQLNTTAGNGYLIKNRDTGNSMLSKSLYLWNDSGPIQFITPSSTLRMTIEQGGNVGIGTSAPGAKLHVNGVSYFTGGDVAIGTTTPSSNYSRQLHVHATGTGASLHLTDSTSGLANGDGFELISHAGNAYVWQRESNSLIFGTAANEKMRITSDGKVGIGTSPSYKFEVVTGASEVGFEYDTHANGTQTIKFNPSSTKAGGTSKIYSSYAGTGATEGKLALGTYSAQTALVIAGGKVGIGVDPDGILFRSDQSVNGNWAGVIKNTHATTGNGSKGQVGGR